MTIPDLYGQITEKDVPEAAPELLRVLNRLQSAIQALATGGISLRDNVMCDVIDGVFSHNVATQVKLTKVKIPGSVVVLGADGYFPISASVAAGGSGGASVTILFSNSGAFRVPATILVLPEGTLTRRSPSP